MVGPRGRRQRSAMTEPQTATANAWKARRVEAHPEPCGTVGFGAPGDRRHGKPAPATYGLAASVVVGGRGWRVP